MSCPSRSEQPGGSTGGDSPLRALDRWRYIPPRAAASGRRSDRRAARARGGAGTDGGCLHTLVSGNVATRQWAGQPPLCAVTATLLVRLMNPPGEIGSDGTAVAVHVIVTSEFFMERTVCNGSDAH